MPTKIHIDIKQGIVSAEGDPKFVREVYSYYKEKLIEKNLQSVPPQEDSVAKPSSKQSKLTSKERSQRGSSKASTNDEGNRINPEKPKLDPSLEIEVPKLEKFYNQFNIKNHVEDVLVFAKYLIDEVGIETPNTDQIFTCFRMIKRRTPKKFGQMFRNAKSKRYGYIDYKSLKEGVNITPIGYNHFDHELERKTPTK